MNEEVVGRGNKDDVEAGIQRVTFNSSIDMAFSFSTRATMPTQDFQGSRQEHSN